ncbi:Scr1 family TA system antitoxin-like transcriptional regulator [Actinocorallia sp. A-T 12471]|uniref:Scr1 family TA system antitoxin-like transcriptional regulator n=1 Tax=Actinocorallia sp. A-T 12471 TaxID=3089813 RepID=UPI0029D1F14E|nr:Scr1 family TA system antitoxin-like transcriptional regulator [Actinocorallia sp. A-T 12471]MDX6743446.1 Scr1 family TA system antitoxin-like transcriptional regulator [Actinocorallia sp. A-T 12471]
MAQRQDIDPDRSIRERIAHDLRFFRERDGLSQSDLGARIGAVKQYVSAIERADPKFNLQTDHARHADELWGLPNHFQRLVKASRERSDEDWYAEHLPLEAKADELFVAQLGLMPGLLQTEDYARAVMLKATGPASLDQGLAERIERQKILSRPKPPLLWVLLDEAALRRVVGSPAIMRGQLERLVELSYHPNLSVRVVPFTVGWHPGVTSSFKIMKLRDKTHAYSETTGGGRLTSRLDEVRHFELRFRRTGEDALNRDDSRSLLNAIAEGFKSTWN